MIFCPGARPSCGSGSLLRTRRLLLRLTRVPYAPAPVQIFHFRADGGELPAVVLEDQPERIQLPRALIDSRLDSLARACDSVSALSSSATLASAVSVPAFSGVKAFSTALRRRNKGFGDQHAVRLADVPKCGQQKM